MVDNFSFLLALGSKMLYVFTYICMLNSSCRVTIRNPSPKDLGYKSNESNTMNLQKVGERAGLLANELTDNKDLKDEQIQKNTNKT